MIMNDDCHGRCPILWFLSQKFWIDNMLVATTTLSIYLHLHATSSSSSSSSSSTLIRSSLVSAIGFALAFHSKITSLLLLPSHLALTFLRRSSFLWLLLLLPLCSPWVLYYHHCTSRWIPSAWPSASLLQSSSFVAQARARPFYYYFLTTFKLHPVYCLSLGSMADAVSSVISSSSSHGRVVLLLWAGGFIGGMTFLGVMGAGE